ncbi:hypothetical protein PVL29_010815 [Vitis rotundifolia]|uniref:Uncharacterized protein n=1 Tax=Vitis rotundifolia TaxID=103349 RepID=A0AA38ZWA1_VITRO|nr:hypothetical protein PVL29_010815 [Vitis rotundifolia]
MVPEDVPFGESPISPDWGIINVLSGHMIDPTSCCFDGNLEEHAGRYYDSSRRPRVVFQGDPR